MGQKISQSKTTIDINVYLSKYYPNYTTIKILNNGMLSKTVLLLDEERNNKCPLVAKIFFKQDFEEEYNNKLEKIKEAKDIIINECMHNVLPIINIVENQRSGIILRQYLEYNLKERIYLMPYLNNIQKIWMFYFKKCHYAASSFLFFFRRLPNFLILLAIFLGVSSHSPNIPSGLKLMMSRTSIE